jgi:integrase
MATLKGVVADYRKDDGTYNVKIRLTHNRRNTYISTSLYVTDRQITRSRKIKDANIVSAIEKKIAEIRGVITRIPGVEYMPLDRLKKTIEEEMNHGGQFSLDFLAYADEKIAAMKKNTARTYISATSHLRRFAGKVDINDLDSRFIVKFRDYLYSLGLATNSVQTHLAKTKHLINLAKDEFNDDYKTNVFINPFKKGVMPKVEQTKHRVLDIDVLREIFSYNGKDIKLRRAAEYFKLSFCLVGMNAIDLYEVEKSSVKGDIIGYNRTKTEGKRQDKAYIEIRIEDEVRELMSKYCGADEHLFNFRHRFKDCRYLSAFCNRHLKKFQDDITFYHARHTWATIAYNDCGIDMQTIHEALNHASDANMKITDVYVKKDFSRIWEANRKVLDYVFGSDNK